MGVATIYARTHVHTLKINKDIYIYLFFICLCIDLLAKSDSSNAFFFPRCIAAILHKENFKVNIELFSLIWGLKTLPMQSTQRQ